MYATFGTRTALKLVDGSLVWLNSGSSLKYPDRFSGSKREVFLNGEAYFEIASNAAKPFIVKTANLTVRATATKFNVSGYTSDFKSEVTLVDGKVFVDDLEKDGSSNLVSELNPNQHLIFNNEDLHNAGILYERVRDRDMMGAPLSSTGTTNFPFPDDDLNVALGAMVLVKDNCKNSILLNHGLKVILIC